MTLAVGGFPHVHDMLICALRVPHTEQRRRSTWPTSAFAARIIPTDRLHVRQ